MFLKLLRVIAKCKKQFYQKSKIIIEMKFKNF